MPYVQLAYPTIAQMRTLFLSICVIGGLLSGLWWTELLPLHKFRLVFSDTPTHNHDADTTPFKDPFEATAAETSGGIEHAVRPHSYYNGITRVAPAVVSIFASNRQSTAQNSLVQDSSLVSDLDDNQDSRQGSGVIVDANGIVLTSLHLVNNSDTINVVLTDGRQFDARLIGSDLETDIAVVEIDASNLPAVELGEARPPKVGDIVLAIGNPFGVGQTVTQGIISATHRRIANGSIWQNFIQTDVAINPGNSGGALINPLGQLVGVNTAVFRGDSNAVGISYAIPAELLSQVVPQIVEQGSVSRGWLGLGVEDLNMFPALANATRRGVVITAVRDEGPAFIAGIRPMDIVIQLGEKPVSSATQLLLAVSALPPGATVKLVLLRGYSKALHQEALTDTMLEEIAFRVRLGNRPDVGEEFQ